LHKRHLQEMAATWTQLAAELKRHRDSCVN
jgi:hypothetical protein